jgi:predicted phage gp36 major capsid-like protein
MANTFKRKLSRAVGTTATAVGGYTVPSSTATTVIGLAVANVTASQVLITATVNDGSNDTHLIKDAPVPSGGSIVIVGGDQKVVLETLDSVKVQSSTASSVDVVMSILEIT